MAQLGAAEWQGKQPANRNTHNLSCRSREFDVRRKISQPRRTSDHPKIPVFKWEEKIVQNFRRNKGHFSRYFDGRVPERPPRVCPFFSQNVQDLTGNF